MVAVPTRGENMKNAFIAAAAGLIVALGCGAASAATVSFTKLTGLTGDPGSPFTAVFKADLSSAGLGTIASFAITDSGVVGGSSPGQFSGFDLDGVIISTTNCATAACVAGLAPSAAIDLVTTFLTPGTQIAPANPKLFGTNGAGTAVDAAVATLGAFDAFASTTTPAGFISLGVNGSIIFNLLAPLNIVGPIYLYIGEVGDNGELAAGGITLSQTTVPLPAALPLFLAGLAGLGAARRRKAAA